VAGPLLVPLSEGQIEIPVGMAGPSLLPAVCLPVALYWARAVPELVLLPG